MDYQQKFLWRKLLLHTENTLQQQLDYYLRNSTCHENPNSELFSLCNLLSKLAHFISNQHMKVSLKMPAHLTVSPWPKHQTKFDALAMVKQLGCVSLIIKLNDWWLAMNSFTFSLKLLLCIAAVNWFEVNFLIAIFMWLFRLTLDMIEWAQNM